ncbi:MAG: hypothetical protein AAF460_14390, partial [Pseudomonadota bacterium]
ERAQLTAHGDLLDGLERAALRAERRPLRLRPHDLQADADPRSGTVWLEFSLRPGQFATAVLHELGIFRDAALNDT